MTRCSHGAHSVRPGASASGNCGMPSIQDHGGRPLAARSASCPTRASCATRRAVRSMLSRGTPARTRVSARRIVSCQAPRTSCASSYQVSDSDSSRRAWVGRRNASSSPSSMAMAAARRTPTRRTSNVVGPPGETPSAALRIHSRSASSGRAGWRLHQSSGETGVSPCVTTSTSAPSSLHSTRSSATLARAHSPSLSSCVFVSSTLPSSASA